MKYAIEFNTPGTNNIDVINKDVISVCLPKMVEINTLKKYM